MRHLVTLLGLTSLVLVASSAAAEPELPTRLDTPDGVVSDVAQETAKPVASIVTKREAAKTDATVALASTPSGTGTPTLGTKGSSGFPMGWLVAVAAGLGTVALIAVLQKKKNVFATKETIKVVAAKQLGPKARVVLVETRGRELLLSVSDRGATLISDWWTDNKESDEVPAAKEELDLPFELLDEDEVVPKDFVDRRSSKNRATRAYAASAPSEASSASSAMASPAATPMPAPIPLKPKAPSSDSNSAVSGLMRLRTSSTTSSAPRAERTASRTASKEAAALDLASDLYGQWSKSLMNGGR